MTRKGFENMLRFTLFGAPYWNPPEGFRLCKRNRLDRVGYAIHQPGKFIDFRASAKMVDLLSTFPNAINHSCDSEIKAYVAVAQFDCANKTLVRMDYCADPFAKDAWENWMPFIRIPVYLAYLSIWETGSDDWQIDACGAWRGIDHDCINKFSFDLMKQKTCQLEELSVLRARLLQIDMRNTLNPDNCRSWGFNVESFLKGKGK